MPTPAEVRRIAEELQRKGLVNLNVSLSDALATEELDSVEALKPVATAARWYVVGGSHYVLVCE
jgi:hypothetical protein